MTAPAPRGRTDGAPACLARNRGPRGFATWRSGFRRGAGLIGLAGLLLSGNAVAQDIQNMTSLSRRCVLQLSHTWIVTGDTARSPDGRLTIQIREVSSGRVFVNFQRAFGMHTLPDRTRDLRVMYASVGDMTRYYAVAPPRSDRACVAQITSRRTDRNAEAESIAGTLRRRAR